MMKKQCHYYEPKPEDFEGCPVIIQGPNQLAEYCFMCEFNTMDIEATKAILKEMKQQPALKHLLYSIGEDAHNHKIKHGWKITTMDDWENPESILSVLMLITTEIAEAAEAVRHDDIENFREELADVFIRTVSFAHGMDIDLADAVIKKMAFNKTRPFKHGDKRI